MGFLSLLCPPAGARGDGQQSAQGGGPAPAAAGEPRSRRAGGQGRPSGTGGGGCRGCLQLQPFLSPSSGLGFRRQGQGKPRGLGADPWTPLDLLLPLPQASPSACRCLHSCSLRRLLSACPPTVHRRAQALQGPSRGGAAGAAASPACPCLLPAAAHCLLCSSPKQG